LEKEPANRLPSARRLLQVLGLERQPYEAAAAATNAAKAPTPPDSSDAWGLPGALPLPQPEPRPAAAIPNKSQSATDAGNFEWAEFPESIAGRRIASAVVDYFSILIALLIAVGAGSVGASIGWLLVFFGAFLWEASNGQSPGKGLLGLTVVGPDDYEIQPGRALARTALKFLSVIFVVPALIDIFVIAATHGSQRLFDKVTGTRVVRSADLEDVS